MTTSTLSRNETQTQPVANFIAGTQEISSGIVPFDSIRIVDVTNDPEGLLVAQRLVASGYATLSSQDVDEAALAVQLCEDEYQRAGLARVFLATGCNPLSGLVEPLGSVRLVVSGRDDGASLECMDLMAPEEGWDRFSFEGFAAQRSAELSRFAIAPLCRTGLARVAGLLAEVLRSLVDAAIHCARREFGKDQVWAIMAEHVVGVVKSAGFQLVKTPEMALNHQKYAGLFAKFDRYWLRLHPRFFRFVTEGAA